MNVRLKSAGAVLLICMLHACAPSKDDLKAAYTGRCNESLLKSFADSVRKEAAARYCDCAGNAVVTRLSDKELRQVAAVQNSGQDTAAVAMLLPVLQPCHDTLMMALETADPIPAPAP
jgi:hypothetical protein